MPNNYVFWISQKRALLAISVCSLSDVYNRHQKIKIGTTESDYKLVKTVVPQGTILFPPLFRLLC